ncbi:hypothetical protein CHARACLAT_002489 [Characodon lateralis]|uniref:Uncharacterized protein n=1 Tax=Characodon lateralis TaxID=208331 RepID=A0ABU7CY01_9TELE|nr:hypothetical protein [Characodon lateralis]
MYQRVRVCLSIRRGEKRQRDGAEGEQHQTVKNPLLPSLTLPAGFRGTSDLKLRWSFGSAMNLYWLEFTCGRRFTIKLVMAECTRGSCTMT